MHDDLFAQAETLAKLDAKKPKQANLRRAISSAYYAVFHYLVHEACCVQIGAQHGQAPFRHALGRAFTHSVMKLACASFGGGTLKDAVIKGLPRARGVTIRSRRRSRIWLPRSWNYKRNATWQTMTAANDSNGPTF